MLRSLWNSRYVAACVCDLRGRVLYVNDAACGLVGRARATLVGGSFYEHVANSSYLYNEHQRLLSYAKAEKSTIELVKIMSSSDISSAADPLSFWQVAAEDVAEAGVTLELRTPRGMLSVDAEVSCHQTSKGEVFLVHVLPVPADQPTITPLQPAATQTPRATTTSTPTSTPTSTATDTTKSSDYHASVRHWLASVPEVFDSLLPGAVAIVDRDGVYHDIRNAPGFFTQVPIEQAIGKTFEAVLPAPAAAERRRAIEHVFNSKTPYHFVASQVTPAGVRYFDVRYSYFDEQFCVGVKYDITEKQQLEHRLAASEARANAILAAIPDGVLTISREGVFLHVQPPKDFQFEHPVSAFVGKHLDDVPEVAEVREAISHFVAQTLETQAQHTYNYEVTMNGKTFYRDLRFSYLDEDTCLIMVRDVSEWMDTALALQGVQARFDQFMRITDDIFAVLDLAEQTLLYINPSYERLTGYSPRVVFADLANMRFLDTIDPRDHQKMHKMYDSLRKGRDCSFEYRLLCRDGSTCWMLLRCRVVLGGKTAVCVNTDISELKRSEANLAASRDQLRNVYDALPDAIARLNHKGEYISVKMPSYFASVASREELLGSRIEDTLPADTGATLREHFERTRKEGIMQVCRYDVPYRGNIVSREVRFTRLADGDVLGIYRDISTERRTERQLEHRERQLQAILDTLPFAISRYDRSGICLENNPTSYYQGYSPVNQTRSSFVGKSLAEIAHPDVRNTVLAHFDALLESGQAQTFEYQLTLDSHTVYREAAFLPLGDDEVLSIRRDITETRKAEHALVHREKQLQAIFDTLPYGISRYSRSGVCLEHKRPSYFKLHTHLSASEVVGKTLEQITPTQIRDVVLRHFQALLETNQTQVFDYQLERDGRILYREATMLPLGDDEVLSIIRDVTDQRRLKQNLIDREQQMRAIFSAMPDVIAQFSHDGVYLGDIHSGHLDAEIPLEQVQGKTFFEMNALAADTAKALHAALEETFATKEEHNHEYGLEIDGKTYYRELRFVYLHEHTCLGILRDITPWREMDKALERALEHSTALLKEVHHRVRNNLQVLSSVLHLHATSLDDELAKRVLTENRRRIQTLALVHRVLYDNDSYAKIALDDYLQSGIGLYAADMRRMKVALELDADNVSADLDHAIPFGLIVNELINNSLRHAFASDDYKNGITQAQLQVTLRQQDNHVTLHVIDNGVGLPDDFANKQEHTLGMSVIGSLSEQLAGTFSICNRDDIQGTHATLTLTC